MTKRLRVTLLRHGHTDSDAVYRGRMDAQLSTQGLQQLRAATQAMQPDRIVTSPLQRCADFARTLSADAMVDERFIEMDFGLWDGRLRDEVWQESAAKVKQFWADPMQVAPPQGENLTQVLARAAEALRQHITKALADNCQHMLIISHGGVIRVLLADILHMSAQGMFQLHLPYGGMAELAVTTFVDQQTGQQGMNISLDLSANTLSSKL